MKMLDVETQNIGEIKSTIENSLGKGLLIKEYNKQGKLLKTSQGTITNTYESVFLVKLNVRGNYINKSYSYVDFITKDIVFEIQ